MGLPETHRDLACGKSTQRLALSATACSNCPALWDVGGCILLWEETWEALLFLWLLVLTSKCTGQHKTPLQVPGPHSRHQTQKVLGRSSSLHSNWPEGPSLVDSGKDWRACPSIWTLPNYLKMCRENQADSLLFFPNGVGVQELHLKGQWSLALLLCP